VVFVDLASPEGDAPIAAYLPTLATLESLKAFLVLDNCEHLVRSAGEAGAIVRACPSVTILTTSRERMRIGGEVVYQIPMLPVAAAMRLFLDRAHDVDRAFIDDDDRREAAEDICRQLDGIPLAIELAASRAPSLGIYTLRHHVTRHLSMLAGGNRDLPTRQQTLKATLSWSYDLLEDQERALFRRLAAFPGPFTADAVRDACCGNDLSEGVAIEALTSLVEKSMMAVETDSGITRYRMLGAARLFAKEKATECGDLRLVDEAQPQ